MSKSDKKPSPHAAEQAQENAIERQNQSSAELPIKSYSVCLSGLGGTPIGVQSTTIEGAADEFYKVAFQCDRALPLTITEVQ